MGVQRAVLGNVACLASSLTCLIPVSNPLVLATKMESDVVNVVRMGGSNSSGVGGK